MKLLVELPPDREAEGRFTIFDDDGAAMLGPVRCRGEADDGEERRHGTKDDDPVHAYGDFPFGMFRIKGIVQDPQPAASYGPFFWGLVPVSGQALEAWVNGRRGIGLHSGALGPGGTLRATHGCCRVDDETNERAAKLVKPVLDAHVEVYLEARPLVP